MRSLYLQMAEGPPGCRHQRQHGALVIAPPSFNAGQSHRIGLPSLTTCKGLRLVLAGGRSGFWPPRLAVHFSRLAPAVFANLLSRAKSGRGRFAQVSHSFLFTPWESSDLVLDELSYLCAAIR